ESQNITPETSLLGNVLQLKKDIIKITSFNQEELLELVKTKSGEYYYSSQGRESVIYIDTKSTN
ncbi:TPA: cystathionine beta-lyase, partial [Streptococcus agalactiae]|nr:cystathionine beta-lyase [Streptococcus agalactiae]